MTDATRTTEWVARLKAVGIEEAAFDLRHILLAAADDAEAEAMVTRRVNREPLSHILGDKPFWTLDLRVTPDVLTPRSDTETLVEILPTQITDRSALLRIADFGTGSGAILLALLSELPNATGLGIDISESALAIARENAARNGLSDRASFRIGNWAEGIADKSLDLAVSNPPYIASGVIDTLEPEVRDHEPRIALDGGENGLDVYHTLIPELFRILTPGGLMAVEIGYDQGDAVMALAKQANFDDVRLHHDLAEQPRIVLGRKRDS
ncbi:MAG: release factor glutamine methyltransferase [Hyphobacterium sp.]|nr:MAG: release factor glutamine methyltransferase [Hyphobacterium sp.]